MNNSYKAHNFLVTFTVRAAIRYFITVKYYYIVFICIVSVLLSCSKMSSSNRPENPPPKEPTPEKTVFANVVTTTPSPFMENRGGPLKEPDNTLANKESANNLAANGNTLVSNSTTLINSLPNTRPDKQNLPLITEKLKIPVAGINPADLRDTFNDARSEGRVHDAIDIIAPEKTPVIAAVGGEIVKFFDSERGGITIYQISSDRKFIFYYAHLYQRAENLREHDTVKQGDVIGYVGNTGNAGPGNNHLHFAIWYVTNPKSYWNGTNINPYPLLH